MPILMDALDSVPGDSVPGADTEEERTESCTLSSECAQW